MNTLLASSNTNRLDSYVEAIVFCSITKELMIFTFVYFNYGSGMCGVGNYVV